MKPPTGVRLPLLLILTFDLFGLLAVPTLYAFQSSCESPLARFGVRPPECDFEASDGGYCERWCRVIVVMHADGSTAIKGRALDAEGLRDELFVFADYDRDMEDPDQPTMVTLALIADRRVAWDSVVDLLELSQDPALAFRRLGVHFVQPDRPRLKGFGFYLGDPGEDLCITVRAAPNVSWERVLTAILAELPPEPVFVGLVVSHERPASGGVEVTITGERN